MEVFDATILRRYLSGNCTEEENVQVRNYLQVNGPEALLTLLDEGWDNAQGIMNTQDTEQLLRNIKSSLAQRVPSPVPAPVIRNPWWKRIAAAAAVLVVLLTGAIVWLGRAHRPRKAIAAGWHTITNTQHHKMTVQLPDRSQVWLGVGSTLQYAADFGQTDRRVQLTGEAFFEVARDSLHPFTVQAGRVNTRVLGTHFNVEAYEKEAFTRISLVEGKVSATYTGADNKDINTSLLPGDRLCYNRKAATVRMENVRLQEEAFTGSSLVLQDISLKTALRRIGQHYGKHIQLHDSIDDKQQLSSVVPGNDLDAALGNIAFVYRLQYHVNKDTVQIYRN
jgi:ferric-dicitrate binding protein FerR (iron transport regulator)